MKRRPRYSQTIYAASATGAKEGVLRPLIAATMLDLAHSFALDGSTGGQRDPDMALKIPRSLPIESSTTPREQFTNSVTNYPLGIDFLSRC